CDERRRHLLDRLLEHGGADGRGRLPDARPLSQLVPSGRRVHGWRSAGHPDGPPRAHPARLFRAADVVLKRPPPMLSKGILIIAALVLATMRPVIADAGELLSVHGIALPENGFLFAFHIDTWGVRVLAVCHFPPGWTLSAGKSLDPSGILSGE